MVTDIITEKRGEIAALCRKHKVRALWIFGSATTDRFDAVESDVDVLVDLGEYDDSVVDRYLNLADDLELLFEKKVDLVTVVGMDEKPRFRENVMSTRVRVYGTGHDRAVA